MKKLTLGQASTLASKLRVENGDVVFSEDLKLPDYDIDWQEACLFALIVDDFKNGNEFVPELVVGRFNYFSISQVYVDLAELERKDLIFNGKSGSWYPAWVRQIDIFELKQKNANVIKAIDFVLSQNEIANNSIKNRLVKIFDFLLYWTSSIDVCKRCNYYDSNKNDCIKISTEENYNLKTIYENCRKGLLEQVANGTLKLNGKGGAQ